MKIHVTADAVLEGRDELWYTEWDREESISAIKEDLEDSLRYYGGRAVVVKCEVES